MYDFDLNSMNSLSLDAELNFLPDVKAKTLILDASGHGNNRWHITSSHFSNINLVGSILGLIHFKSFSLFDSNFAPRISRIQRLSSTNTHDNNLDSSLRLESHS